MSFGSIRSAEAENLFSARVNSSKNQDGTGVSLVLPSSRGSLEGILSSVISHWGEANQ